MFSLWSKTTTLYNSYELIDLSPLNYSSQLQALTIDENDGYIDIPISYAIVPRREDVESLRSYAALLGSVENVSDFVVSVIEWATFTLASLVTMQHVLTPEFRVTLRYNIDAYLRRYGMRVYDDWVEFDGDEEIEEEENVAVLNEHDEIEIDYNDGHEEVEEEEAPVLNEHDEIEIDYNDGHEEVEEEEAPVLNEYDEIEIDYYDV